MNLSRTAWLVLQAVAVAAGIWFAIWLFGSVTG